MKRIKKGGSVVMNGFVLPVILILLSAFYFLVLMSLLLLQDQRTVSTLARQDFLLEQAAQSALQEALGKLTHAVNREHYLTHYAATTDPSDSVPLLSWYENDAWHHLPLQSATPKQVVPTTKPGDRYQPAAFPRMKPKQASLFIPFRKSGRDQLRRVPSEAHGEGVSYAYWIEDLGGRLAYEAVTYQGEAAHDSYDSRLTEAEHLARHEYQMRDLRHVALSAFHQSKSVRLKEYQVDYNRPLERRYPSASGRRGTGIDHLFAPLLQERVSPLALTEGLLPSLLPASLPSLSEAFTLGLRDTCEVEVVPHGHSYPNAGSLKMNLNEKVRTQDVESLAAQIRNIPGFQDNDTQYAKRGIITSGARGTRYGGFAHEDYSYTRTLAASIIDYADPDCSPTHFNGGEGPSYQGIDGYPYWNEVGRAYCLSAATDKGVVLQIRTFLELWNPTNQTISGYPELTILPDPSHRVEVGGVPYSIPSEKLYYWKDQPVVLRPNEYRVIECAVDADHDYRGDQNRGRPLCSQFELVRAGGLPVYSAKLLKSAGNRLLLKWSVHKPTQGADFQTIGGHDRGSFRMGYTNYLLPNEANAYVSANCVPNYPHLGQTGDPRAQMHNRSASGFISYAKRASFGGQNDLREYGRVDFERQFPDVCYNSRFYGKAPREVKWPLRGLYLPGERGYIHYLDRSDTVLPAQPYPPYEVHLDGPRAVQILSNRGSFVSLGELGNIYDPAQWRGVQRPFDAAGKQNPSSPNYGQADPVEELGALGGGMTLAVGSPEFNAFEREGYESARLLDQFRVTKTPLRSLKSRVNLNTASREVLTALFSGFDHYQDRMVGPFVEQPRCSEEPASAFVEAILSHRRGQPFLSLSEIARLRDEAGRFVFGEKAVYQRNEAPTRAAGMPPERWNDPGREELFARTYDLFTVKSRSYRISLVAAQEGKRGLRYQRAIFDVTIHPYRTADGLVDRSRSPEIYFNHRAIR